MRSFLSRGGRWVIAQGMAFAVVAWALWRGGRGDVAALLLWPGIAVGVAGIGLAADGAYRIRRHITALPAPVAGAPLVAAGSFSVVRHPIYGGLCIVALGLALARGSLAGVAAAAGLTWFFAAKSSREEEMLAAAYPDYEAYRRRVPKRLIPWVL